MSHTPRRGRARQRALATLAILPLLLGTAACAEDTDESDNDKASSSQGAEEKVDAPAGSFAGKAATGEPVKIGLINQEDSQSSDMPEARVSAEAAVAYANEHLGGIGGRPIEIELCKYQGDANSASACANQLVQADVAGVVITNTGIGAAMAPIITKAGIAYTSYNATAAEEVTSDGAFAWTGGVASSVSSFARRAAQDGAKKFTLFVIDTGEVIAALTAMSTPIFEAAGVELTLTPIPVGVPDASPQVTAGLKDNPDAVGIIADTTVCTAALKGLSTVGNDKPVYVVQPCVDDSVFDSVGDAIEGATLFTSTDWSSDSDEARLYRAIMAEYAPDGELAANAPSGYQSMMTFIRVANAGLGETEPDAKGILAALRTAKEVPLALADGITVTCDGQQMPGMPAMCGNRGLTATLVDGEITDVQPF